MSNGLKVGILVVIAGALGFLGYTQFKKSSNDIESRPAETAAMTPEPSAATGAAGDQANTEPGQLSQSRAKTTVAFDKTEHDFGTIKQGDQVECVFKINNTGQEPLIIEEAHGSCGCTVPDYPKDPIPAGQSRDMKVKFNSTGKKGKQSKTVMITANTEPIQSVVTIHAMVDAPETDGKEKGKGGH
jgi:Protein of unknown function (DUF1573)